MPTTEWNVQNGGSASQVIAQANAARDAAIAAAAKAQEWAINPEDDTVEVLPDRFSALHWAAKSQGFADDAQTSANIVLALQENDYGSIVAGVILTADFGSIAA